MSVDKSPVYNVRTIPIEKIQAFHLGRWFHHALCLLL